MKSQCCNAEIKWVKFVPFCRKCLIKCDVIDDKSAELKEGVKE